ncbi:hypothetical protein R1flu_008925 [Riccia fluitans]|uniref:Uncharacterized protein n=1 Tax=Riccia fluitans TaxID=41844 RepID=A0ABD1Z0L6_9MARC
MAFRIGGINLNAVAQGVGGLVFGSGDRSSRQDDGGVERLLERIQHGVLADDRRAAMSELQIVVAEDRAAKVAFGSMGFPIIMAIFRDEREDIDMIRGALETLLASVTSEGSFHEEQSGMIPHGVNSEVFARESGSVAMLLSLLDDGDFYVRYYTLQVLTALLTHCAGRLQEVILSTPHGITRLMDMMQEREVIRNEALLLLTYLTRAAEEIQKIVVFEGAFEKIFAIIAEEGGSEGGIIVQDCLELLNNLLRNNSSNQIFLRETYGLQQIVHLLRLRKGSADGFSEQKSVNLLCALETVALLLAGNPSTAPGKDSNVLANQTVLGQNKLLDALLSLCVEGRVSAVAIRCSALRCIGDLVVGHSKNRELLGSKIVGEEPDSEPALNCVLRVLLRTSNVNECIAADYVFKCFCEGNSEGQTMLGSTITPLPHSTSRGNWPSDDDRSISFGSMLVRVLISSDGRNDLEASSRAASVLAHILKDNVPCKEKVLRIPLEIPSSALAPTEFLMPRCMRYLAAAASPPSDKLQSNDGGYIWLQPVLLRLLVTWLTDCPPAVASLLEPAAHLPFLVELSSSSGSPASVHVAGLAAVLLGECIVYNPSKHGPKDASVIVDVVNERIGLSAYFSKWEEMQKSGLFISAATSSRLPKPLTRSTAAAAAAGDGLAAIAPDRQQQLSSFQESSHNGEPAVTTFYDSEFVAFIRALEPVVRERIVEVFAHPRSRASVELVGFEQKEGEKESDYIIRLRTLLQNQGQEMQDLVERNGALAEDLLRIGHGKDDDTSTPGEGASSSLQRKRSQTTVSKAEYDSLRQRAEAFMSEKEGLVSEITQYKQLVAKYEADLQGLSEAYNTLENSNYRLEKEIDDLRKGLEGKEYRPWERTVEDFGCQIYTKIVLSVGNWTAVVINFSEAKAENRECEPLLLLSSGVSVVLYLEVVTGLHGKMTAWVLCSFSDGDLVGGGKFKKDVSVAKWDGVKGLAEVTLKKGKLWCSMGIMRGSKLYCNVEEAVYLVGLGSLALLHDGKVMYLQEVYNLLLTPAHGCSWIAYQTFAYLKRLGYIVGRHGIPWTTSRKRESLTPSKTTLDNHSPSNEEEHANTRKGIYDSQPREIVDDHDGELDSSAKGTASPDLLNHWSVEAIQEAEASVSSFEAVTLDFPGTDENDLSGKGAASSILVGEGGEEEVQGVGANVSPCETGRPELLDVGAADCGDTLQNLCYLTLNQVEDSCDALLMYDVFLPNGRFKKSSPGLPAFRLCISSGQPPKHNEVRALELKSGDAPLKFACVESGHVSIFSFDTVSLPDLP